MLPATDATAAYYALSDLLRVPFAEVRPATDLVKDPWGRFIDEVLAKAEARQATASPTVNPESAKAKAIARTREPELSGMGPWLVDTMEIIDAQRRALGGSADNRSGLALLATAEKLASYISDASPRRRPQLNIEPNGRPTFATAVDDFYIHLTVDDPNSLTWYATVGGVEHFNEGVSFDGRRIPAELKQLLSL